MTQENDQLRSRLDELGRFVRGLPRRLFDGQPDSRDLRLQIARECSLALQSAGLPCAVPVGVPEGVDVYVF